MLKMAVCLLLSSGRASDKRGKRLYSQDVLKPSVEYLPAYFPWKHLGEQGEEEEETTTEHHSRHHTARRPGPCDAR
jgi:hypothetical protein